MSCAVSALTTKIICGNSALESERVWQDLQLRATGRKPGSRVSEHRRGEHHATKKAGGLRAAGHRLGAGSCLEEHLTQSWDEYRPATGNSEWPAPSGGGGWVRARLSVGLSIGY
jgi:hypothetical protein